MPWPFTDILGSPATSTSYRIGLLTSISGVPFDDAWASRVPGRLGEHEVHYIGLQALLRNKAASGRDKDLADIKTLRAVEAKSRRTT